MAEAFAAQPICKNGFHVSRPRPRIIAHDSARVLQLGIASGGKLTQGFPSRDPEGIDLMPLMNAEILNAHNTIRIHATASL
jgi:hypothetical protein